jgi:hypothetical protein
VPTWLGKGSSAVLLKSYCRIATGGFAQIDLTLNEFVDLRRVVCRRT